MARRGMSYKSNKSRRTYWVLTDKHYGSEPMSIWEEEKGGNFNHIEYPEGHKYIYGKDVEKILFTRIPRGGRIIESESFTFGESVGVDSPISLKRQVKCMFGEDKPLKITQIGKPWATFKVGHKLRNSGDNEELTLKSIFYDSRTWSWMLNTEEIGLIPVWRARDLKEEIYTISDINRAIRDCGVVEGRINAEKLRQKLNL